MDREAFFEEIKDLTTEDLYLILTDQRDLYSSEEIKIIKEVYMGRNDKSEDIAFETNDEELIAEPEEIERAEKERLRRVAEEQKKIDEEQERLRKEAEAERKAEEERLKKVAAEQKKISEEYEKSRKETEEERKAQQELIKAVTSMPVTTSDITKPYDILGPIITNTSNKGVFSSAWTKLQKKYNTYPFDRLIIKPSKESVNTSELGMAIFTTLFDPAFGFEGAVGQSSFDKAFYICVTELKLRCLEMGGDAIVGMKMDFDLDTSNYGAFYLQMYGTAVKLKKE